MRLAGLARLGLSLATISASVTTAGAQAASPQMHATGNAANAVRHTEEEAPPLELGPLSTSEKQGYGCLAAGGASLVVAGLVGTDDVLLVFTGATAVPAGVPVGLGLAVVGTVFASTCAVGALVAPTAIRLWKYDHDGATIAQTP